MRTVYALLGTHTIHVFNTLSSNAVEYDACCRAISFNDPVHTGNNINSVKGGAEIMMYNGTSWEILRESTTGVIENIGRAIRLMVFGSQDGTLEGSGLVTQTDMASLFSGFTDPQTGAFSFAQIGTFVTMGPDGAYITGAKIMADKVDVTGKDIDFTAARSLNLNAPIITLYADNITFRGRDIITNEENGQTVIKFSVDANGNVTMNGLTAVNATLRDFTAINARISSGSITGLLDVGTYGAGNNSIRINPNTGQATPVPAIEGYHGTTKMFSLEAYASISIGDGVTTRQVDGAKLILGSSEYSNCHFMVQGENGNSYINGEPYVGMLHMRYQPTGSNIWGYFSIRIDSTTGKIHIGGNRTGGSQMIWPDESEAGLGQLYKDSNGFIHVKLT